MASSNLSGADLRMANLSEANLNGANLSGASLRVANLSEANLSAAIGVTAQELERMAKSLEGATMSLRASRKPGALEAV
jgi:uncharacterized protein YjbI with pentapeptide repeats